MGELLKQIAPEVTRVAVLRDSTIGTGTSQFAVIQAVARRWVWKQSRSTASSETVLA